MLFGSFVILDTKIKCFFSSIFMALKTFFYLGNTPFTSTALMRLGNFKAEERKLPENTNCNGLFSCGFRRYALEHHRQAQRGGEYKTPCCRGWRLVSRIQSGVALRLPPHSKRGSAIWSAGGSRTK